MNEEYSNQLHNKFVSKIIDLNEVHKLKYYWVEYLGNRSELTSGKWYQILDRNNRFSFKDEHYYFLNDKEVLVGMYSHGNFRNVTNEKKRDDKLKTILNDK